MKRALAAPVQYGYVVRDLARTMADWRRRVDLGPFFILERLKIEQADYRGAPIELELTAALAQSGGVQIELLVQTSPARSALTEGDDGRNCRLHHIGYILTDADVWIAELQAMGHAVATRGLAPGGVSFAYVDTIDPLGHMIEISPDHPAILEIYGRIRGAALDWDGSDPVRYL